MASPHGPSNQDSPERTETYPRPEQYDFSLILGGPLFQLFRRSHPSVDPLELLRWRVVGACVIAWLPLLLLVLASGGKTGLALFCMDVEMHVRFLIALPILIVGEFVAHARVRSAVRAFISRRLIPPDDLVRFGRIIESGIRLRNSMAVQLALLILVYTVGLWLWHNRVSIAGPTWYAMPGGRWNLTPPGYWYVFVSIPIAQFLLLCWYWRFFVWCRFLAEIARIKLNLVATHPDHCAGLGFLATSSYGFGPVLFAQGAMVAGVVASRVLYRGENLMSFKLEILGFVAFFVLAVLGPLLVFTPQIAAVRRKGLAIYGQLGQDYVESFEHKWAVRSPASAADLLGTGDIQSLADLANSYGIVASMRIVPFNLIDITRLALAAAAPFAPLLLTVFSLEELVMRLIDSIF